MPKATAKPKTPAKKAPTKPSPKADSKKAPRKATAKPVSPAPAQPIKVRPDRARFPFEYLVDRNATKAAMRCGYSPKSARGQGQRLLTNVDISAQIKKAEQARVKRTLIDADRTLTELGIIGFADMAHYVRFGANGSAEVDFSTMPPEATRAIAEVTTKRWMEGRDGDEQWFTETKVKLHPKTPALNLIAQHLGMLVTKHQHTGADGGPIQTEDVTDPKEVLLAKVQAMVARAAMTAAGAEAPKTDG